MSTNHGEILMQKPISEYAIYIKNLIPANIPETYTLKPMFENVASEENIRNGVIVVMGTSAGGMNMSNEYVDECTVYEGMALNLFSPLIDLDKIRTFS